MRPKFRNSNETNIYFYSKKKWKTKKKVKFLRQLKYGYPFWH